MRFDGVVVGDLCLNTMNSYCSGNNRPDDMREVFWLVSRFDFAMRVRVRS